MLHLRCVSFSGLSNLVLKNCKVLTAVPKVRLSSAVGGSEDVVDQKPKASQRLTYNVSKYGELSIRGVASSSFKISPINPQLHPDQNLAFIDVPNNVKLKVDSAEERLAVRSLGTLHVSECYLPTCDIEMPISYNADVLVEGWSSVDVSNLQNDRIMIATERGDCSLSNLQSNGISAQTSGGNIMSQGLIHSNTILKAQQDGAVTLNKILSQFLDVRTDRGTIDVKSLYSDQSKFCTESGNVHIKNAHRNIEINIRNQGNLTVGSLDGNLSASLNTGNVEVFISRTDNVDIHVQSGNISLKLSPSLDAHLDLEGNSVAIDDEICLSGAKKDSGNGVVSISGDMGKKEALKRPTVRAHTKTGSVIVQLQSWVDSLKIPKSDE